jgi:pimeloyl-ACP methyl ester carboxylesterase
VGGGAVDLVLSSYGTISIDSIWDNEHFTSFVMRLAASCRVVLHDTRGIGLSDAIDIDAPPSIEQQADDLRAVLDAAQATRPVVIGVGDGGPTAITYATRHRSGLVGLVLVNTFARLVEADDYPAGVARERFDANLTMSVDTDSQRDTSHVLRNHAPSVAGDAEFRSWWDRAGRRGASPSTAAALWRVRYGADVRSHLKDVAVPTLVVHRRGSRVVPSAHGAYLAKHLPDARFVEVDGSDQPPFTEGGDEIAELIARFATDATSRSTTGRA